MSIIGTKLKWFLNDETYRIAVVKAYGVLQVKSVTDGGGHCHDNKCICTACQEFYLVPRPPWRTRLPLKITKFANEFAWRVSLPKGGKILITLPY